MMYPRSLIWGAFFAIAGLITSAGMGSAENVEDIDAQLRRDLAVVQKPIFDLTQLAAPRHIEVVGWVDKTSRTYVVGQPLKVMVRSHQDSYITVVDVGSSGRISLLFPNHFQEGIRVRAGSTLAIPANSARWQIKVAGPPGVELIQVIASAQPLTLPELAHLVRTTRTDPTVLVERSPEDVARDLVTQLKPEQTSSDSLSKGFGVRNVLVRILASAENQLK